MKRHELIARLTLLTAVMMLATGCAAGAPETEPPEDDDGEDRENPEPPAPEMAPGDLDYTNTPWTLTNVSRTANTISHHGQLALVGDHAVVAFSEPTATDFGDQDIHRAVRVGDSWETHSVTVGSDAQLAFPNVVSTGGALWYAFTGPSEDEVPNGDIWLRREVVGSAIGDPINATAPAAGVEPTRSDARSQLVPRPDGGVSVVYISRPIGGDIFDNDVRVVVAGADGQLTAPVIVATPETYCSDLIATGDDSGAVHAIADCGSLLYISNASGSWQTMDVPLGASRSPSTPDIAIDSVGGVHVTWTATVDCEAETTCRRVHHSVDLGEPTEVATENGFMAEVAVDANGRVLVIYHRTGDAAAVMITHADDGRTFAAPRPIADTPERDTSVSHLQFDTRGWPHVLFQRVFSGTDPLDSEIMHGTIHL